LDKMKYSILFCIFTLQLMAFCTVGLDNQARYDNYRVYRLFLSTEKHLQIFQEIEKQRDSYAFFGHPKRVNQRLKVMVAAHKIPEISFILEKNNIEYEILIYNFQEKIDNELKSIKPANVNVNEFGWDHYYHLETIYAWLDQVAVQYKDVVKVINVGTSYNGLPLKGVKLSYKPNNPAVFVEGGIHGREWISPATASFILNQLLTSKKENIRFIAQNWDWFFFPVFNPDGYRYSFRKDRMWRKTRQPFGSCVGTDLNRNWDRHWNQIGASPDPCQFDYAGPRPFSEPEAEQFARFLSNNVKSSRIRTYLSLHSFSQLLLFPFSSTNEKVRNYNDLMAIGTKAVNALHSRYGTQFRAGSLYETIFPLSGCSMDWVYTKLNIPIVYTFELRGPINSTDMFLLPAEQIIPTGLETLGAIETILLEAKKLGYYGDVGNKGNGLSGIEVRQDNKSPFELGPV